MNSIVMTNTGVVRSENQDKAAIFQKNGIVFAILCDGMGGHKGGSHASRITVETFRDEFHKNFPYKDGDDINSWFANTLKIVKMQMNNYAKNDKELIDMGTTLTAAIVINKNVYVYNIGDSRTYVYNGFLHQITRDHNLRNYYIDNKGYSNEEAATLVGAMALTSALGPTKQMFIENFLVEFDEDIQYIFLTSDGVHDYVSNPVLINILKNDKMTVEQKAGKFITEAIAGKSSDNLTVAILEYK